MSDTVGTWKYKPSFINARNENAERAGTDNGNETAVKRRTRKSRANGELTWNVPAGNVLAIRRGSRTVGNGQNIKTRTEAVGSGNGSRNDVERRGTLPDVEEGTKK
ncbi:hypothetical protein R1flu_009161 [Riccia fluitans]|uniref:Uncharacterized protein n=1 Tax=Riccia fluitans TaxID=41844 RepID=A0ABD1Z2G6_9MARC